MPRISLIIIAFLFCSRAAGAAQPIDTVTSTMQAAILFLDTAAIPDASPWWPHAKSTLFKENLKINILTPLSMYQGSNTNFCGYAALSYLPLHDDPLGYTRFLLALYKDGKATWGNIHFH